MIVINCEKQLHLIIHPSGPAVQTVMDVIRRRLVSGAETLQLKKLLSALRFVMLQTNTV